MPIESVDRNVIHRAYYYANCDDFLNASDADIYRELVHNSIQFDLTSEQESAWNEEIKILKDVMRKLGDGQIIFEYTIPRMGKRVDAVIIRQGNIFLLEFKVFKKDYPKDAIDQVEDYALDLHNFHKSSHDVNIFPILVSTLAHDVENNIEIENNVAHPIKCNAVTLPSELERISRDFPSQKQIDSLAWVTSSYKPTPTIIEAAQALYSNHNVEEIIQNDAEDINLTTDVIKRIIQESKTNKRKSIIFVTGVPGAGKTLVGLNLANMLHNCEKDEHAVFLSGNHPLVSVLQSALANDKYNRELSNGRKINKKSIKREVGTFVQMIYHYRDEYFGNDNAPSEKITIFDEAQRAWTKEELQSFLRKKGRIRQGEAFDRDYQYSEPGFLISTLDRHQDWAVIVCLVGGGQEINRGEAGMPEWFDSLRAHFSHWDVYATAIIKENEYLRNRSWNDLVDGLSVKIENNLHLSVDMRSFRCESVARFVNFLLSDNLKKTREVYDEVKERYPIYITRDITAAKRKIRAMARGTERFGLLSSSSAMRLKSEGIYYVKKGIAPDVWFLNDKDDIRSSYSLEVVASEFETQGLEMDYAIIAWDADLRIENGKWKHYQMSNRKKPPNWSAIPSKNINARFYLTNAYRVLLTRARQGLIIYIPNGDEEDITRNPAFYNETYKYLKSIGIEEI